MPAQSLAPTVLLTRPAAQSDSFAQSLQARVVGLRVVVSPLMATVFHAVTLPKEPLQGVILTSQTGAEAAGRLRTQLPDLAYCVGDRTAQVAREAGFRVQSAQGDAEALLALILREKPQNLIHLRGREARGDLAQRLSAAGVFTQDRVVYAQEAQLLSDEAVALLSGKAAVLVPLFSPRSAEILGAAWQGLATHAPLVVVAISQAVAEAAAFCPTKPVLSAHPDAPSMLDAVLAQLLAP
jgi:uroporphyrinogen-III synthase